MAASQRLSSSLIRTSSIFRSPSTSLRSYLIRSTLIFRSSNLNFCTHPMRMSTAAGPWLMLPSAFESGGSNMVYNFYSLPENKVVSLNNNRSPAPPISLNPQHTTEILGSSHGWLALFNRINCDLFLWNPITGRHVKLPPIHTLPIPQENLDGGYGCVSKVVLSCDDPGSEDCRAMIIFNTVDSLAFCCPSLSTEWTPIGALRPPLPYESGARDYEDVVFSKNLFFCLTEIDVNDFEGWDVRDLHSPKLHWSNHNDLLGEKNYLSWLDQTEKSLFESTKLFCRPLRYLVAAPDDQLFLVTRHMVEQMAPDGEDPDSDNEYPHKTIAFDVHKIDRDEDGGRGKLTHVDGLDGLAMFVGLNHSFAVPASDHQLKPNSIYFTDGLPRPSMEGETYGGHDIGIFNYKNRTITPCYYPCEVQSFKLIEPAPIWFTPTSH